MATCGNKVVFTFFLTAQIVLSSVDLEVSQGRRLYSGYQVLRAYPDNKVQRGALLLLSESVDFWTDVVPANKKVDLMVNPDQLERVKEFLAFNTIYFEVMIQDLQEDINEENEDIEKAANSTSKRDKRQNTRLPHQQRQETGPLGLLFNLPFIKTDVRRRRRPVENSPPHPVPQTSSNSVSPCASTGMNWQQYHNYNTIQLWMECMAEHFSHKMSLIDIGKSSEGRRLTVAKIGKQGGQERGPAVFIDGGIHAREWASPAAVTYLIHRLVETEGEYDNTLERMTIYILPLANPDGYEYSRDHDRMWRKTRSKTGSRNLFGQACHGVDPNRNFGYAWGGYGASEDACKETFRGKTAFSEPETQAMRDFLLDEPADFKLYLTFHSYGQYILYPWGYDKVDTRDTRELKRVGDVTGRALRRINGVKYEIGAAAKMLYPASGGSDDWAKGAAGIKYSYTIELPDTGRHGFILPARYIKNVGFQATTVLKAMVAEIRETLPKA